MLTCSLFPYLRGRRVLAMTGSEILGWAIGIEMRVWKVLWAYGCLVSVVGEGFEGDWDSYDPSFLGRWMALVARCVMCEGVT